MTWMVCWLVIHTSHDALDNRKYIQVKGYTMKEYMQENRLNFHDDFIKLHVDEQFNSPVQLVNDNECLYVDKVKAFDDVQ